MADTYYSDTATAQNAALTNSAATQTYKDEILVSHGVITLSGASVQNDVHRIAFIPAGAILLWETAGIVSTNAALAGTIGLVNADTGVYTAYATLTAATNIGRASAPTNITFAATTANQWVAYQLGASPPTSGTALITVGRKVLSC